MRILAEFALRLDLLHLDECTIGTPGLPVAASMTSVILMLQPSVRGAAAMWMTTIT